MPLFRKPKTPAAKTATQQPATQQPGPPIDELVGDPGAHHFRAELAAGRWREFHDFLEACRDWDDRNFYLLHLADIEGRPEWIDQWKAERPRSAVPLLFSGTHGIHWAWQARGSGRATTVKEDAWPVFHGRLVEGDRELAKAAGMDETDPTPYARSLPAAKGLSLGVAELRRRFTEVVRRHPWHQGSHASMVDALASKWSGSDELMFGFARDVMRKAPEGHGVHEAIALAHIEKWMNLPRESQDGKELQLKYFRRDDVAAEVRRAADLSIRSPLYRPSKHTALDRNTFAFCFWLMHDYAEQLEQMRLIGSLNQAAPWHYQGKPGWAYERARTRALAYVQGTATPP